MIELNLWNNKWFYIFSFIKYFSFMLRRELQNKFKISRWIKNEKNSRVLIIVSIESTSRVCWEAVMGTQQARQVELPSKEETFIQCWYNVGPSSATLGKRYSSEPALDQPANTRHWPNAGLMLAHRLWRWSSTKPAMGLLGGVLLDRWVYMDHQ